MIPDWLHALSIAFLAFGGACAAIFRAGFGTRLETDTPEFWFMMQIAMLCGFATAYR